MKPFSQFLLLWFSILGLLILSVLLVQSLFWIFGPAGPFVLIVLVFTGGIAWAFSDL